MAARCTNGHDTPAGAPCMYCGAPLLPPAPPPVPPYSFAPSAPTPAPTPPGTSVGRILVIVALVLVGLGVAIVVLGAIVVFVAGGIVDKSDTTSSTRPPSAGSPQACRIEARTLGVASEAYYAQNNRYPATIDDLVAARMIRKRSDLYQLQANGSAPPDLVPIDGACGGITIPGG